VKTNLMIFIKPTVLRTSADGRDITSERYEYLMGEQIRQAPPPRIFWGDQGQPTLPPQGIYRGRQGRSHAAADARRNGAPGRDAARRGAIPPAQASPSSPTAPRP
jgi:general secretion pathway protein D